MAGGIISGALFGDCYGRRVGVVAVREINAIPSAHNMSTSQSFVRLVALFCNVSEACGVSNKYKFITFIIRLHF